ncbi:uncharacterized protein BO88DRAFT_489466 [Aspergillus vadensis CBS 113365]|uniref:Uncharacterized protein n=1 Tax=Aspergillus vadensis (strain CBS 113365 / IMI 142717 / IBT 24658) TaxID=1448311 RepID=A0A319B9P7_ASPVC|nr:hypothetical protein BO88DRAFT_489466 [Aspergillus vadensis CBS 113365]PYH67180.1 hypothetical protein BO88DRAFT_489466 [Aspergillus vadensis CBS 113365]
MGHYPLLMWTLSSPRPLSTERTRLYLIILLAVRPYWVVEIYANFAFFNRGQALFTTTRPLEPLFRDPWWIFTTCFLVYIIQRAYGCSLVQLIRISPRFGVMLLFMVISVVFAVVDMCAIRVEHRLGYPPGIEPFWKLAFVFKCLHHHVGRLPERSDRLRYHYHPDGVPPQEATHARGQSTNRLVDCVPEAFIERPNPSHTPYNVDKIKWLGLIFQTLRTDNAPLKLNGQTRVVEYHRALYP